MNNRNDNTEKNIMGEDNELNFSDLPLEILMQIINKLSLLEYGSLQRTSNVINQVSHDSFEIKYKALLKNIDYEVTFTKIIKSLPLLTNALKNYQNELAENQTLHMSEQSNECKAALMELLKDEANGLGFSALMIMTANLPSVLLLNLAEISEKHANLILNQESLFRQLVNYSEASLTEIASKFQSLSPLILDKIKEYNVTIKNPNILATLNSYADENKDNYKQP